MTVIPPGETGKFKSEARNPEAGPELVWKAHQLFEDATRADWVDPHGSKRPTDMKDMHARMEKMMYDMQMMHRMQQSEKK